MSIFPKEAGGHKSNTIIKILQFEDANEVTLLLPLLLITNIMLSEQRLLIEAFVVLYEPVHEIMVLIT